MQYDSQFNDMKTYFNQDTGREWNKDLSEFIQYVQAQCLSSIMNSMIEVKNGIDEIKEILEERFT